MSLNHDQGRKSRATTDRSMRWLYFFNPNLNADAQFFQALDSFLLILPFRDPEVVLIFHDIRQHCSTKENHVLSSGWIFNANLEFLQKKRSSTLRRDETCNILLRLMPYNFTRLRESSRRGRVKDFEKVKIGIYFGDRRNRFGLWKLLFEVL